MTVVLAAYTEGAIHVMFALLVTAFCLLLACCIGGMLYALYKGATDETWR